MPRKFDPDKRFTDKKIKRDDRFDKPSAFRTKEFFETQKEWYQKLEESGFRDIESFNPDLPYSQDSRFIESKISPAARQRLYTQNPYQFFRILSLFLHSDALRDLSHPDWYNFHCFLLENYSNGLSYREIRDLVKSEIDPHAHQPTGTQRHRRRHPEYPRYTNSLTQIFERMKKLSAQAVEWFNAQEGLAD